LFLEPFSFIQTLPACGVLEVILCHDPVPGESFCAGEG
jgi:hypothetical protein